jgi:DNA primase
MTDSVVFCFDGDNAGRKAAWRALENTLPVLADGKNASFLFLPDGEDPDDFIRKRGKAAFEAAIAEGMPLSEFLQHELAARHPPTSPESRAALVTAARPLLSQIAAPVLSAILRKRLAELTGLPEVDLRELLAAGAATAGPPSAGDRPARPATAMPATPAARPRASPRFGQARRPPSLARQLIRGLLLKPALAKSLPFPGPDETGPEAATLTALVMHCAAAQGEPTTGEILAAFAETPHADVLASVLATAQDQHLTAETIEAEVRDGLDRWWQQQRRSGRPAPASATVAVPAEESKRLQQLEYVRQRMAERTPPESAGGRSAEEPPRDII